MDESARYKIRVRIELLDVTGKYVAPAETSCWPILAQDDAAAIIKKNHCWNDAVLAVYREVTGTNEKEG